MKNYYDYTISRDYDKTVFEKTVELLLQKVKDIEESEYDEDLFDEFQIQYIKTSSGEIRVKNDFMAGAVWVESEVDLDDILKEWEDKTFYETANRILTPEEGHKMIQEVEEAATKYREYVKQRKQQE